MKLFVRSLGQDGPAALWIAGKLGMTFMPPFEVIAIFDGETLGADDTAELLGGFVLTGRSSTNVDLSFYGPGLLTQRVLAAVAYHVFHRLMCQRATVRCRRTNTVARRAAEAAGFVYEGTQRRYFGPTKHDDAMVYGMIRSECRWLEGVANGARRTRPASNGQGASGDEQRDGDHAIPARRH